MHGGAARHCRWSFRIVRNPAFWRRLPGKGARSTHSGTRAHGPISVSIRGNCPLHSARISHLVQTCRVACIAGPAAGSGLARIGLKRGQPALQDPSGWRATRGYPIPWIDHIASIMSRQAKSKIRVIRFPFRARRHAGATPRFSSIRTIRARGLPAISIRGASTIRPASRNGRGADCA